MTIDDLAGTTQDEFRTLRQVMATKDDLKQFATKDDLRHFATKTDLGKISALLPKASQMVEERLRKRTPAVYTNPRAFRTQDVEHLTTDSLR